MRVPPIRVRMTAWYVFVISITLAAAAAFMYFAVQHAVEETVDSQLRARSDAIGYFLSTLRQPRQGGASILPAAAGSDSPRDDLYQIASTSGTIVFQSPAMAQLQVPLAPNVLQHHYRHHRDAGEFTTYYRRHDDVRVLATEVRSGAEVWHVQVATDVNPFYAVLETYRKLMWIAIPLIAGLAGTAGYWLSGRAMKPVRVLADATSGISEFRLSDRVPLPSARDELYQLTETINAMLARLEAAFSRVARLTADASHELRTPVAVIRTTSEVILERDRTPEEVREMVTTILREAEFSGTLIDQLLTLARTDEQGQELRLEEIDGRALIQETVSAMGVLAEDRGLHLETRLPDDPMTVEGDHRLLRQLLVILVDNACHYTGEGGTIRVSLKAESRDVLIEVTDSGIGIPENEIAHIFDRFYRASNGRFFHVGGTGLGLALADWIVKAHHGSLSVTSRVGEGTRVSLQLRRPAARQLA